MTDRLSIERGLKETLLAQLDKYNVLGLKGDGNRIDLFMFAMSLGVKKGIRTPLKSKEGLILKTSIGETNLSYIYSLAINELRKEKQENKACDDGVSFEIAEEYANTGFEEIKRLIPDFSIYKEEDFSYMLLDELQSVYERIEN